MIARLSYVLLYNLSSFCSTVALLWHKHTTERMLLAVFEY